MTISSSTETDQVFAAFIPAQTEFLHVVKETEGARGKFASFPDVVEMIRPILNRNGLFFSQLPMPCDGASQVRTLIAHTSGQWFADDGLPIPYAKLDPQGAGSSLSYAKRYGLLSVCGVATGDDDGAAALSGIEAEKRENAAAAALAAARLSPRQAQIITAIMVAAGHPNPDLDDKLEEDYPTHVTAAVKYAVKQKAVTAADAEDVQAHALALDLAKVQAELAVPA